MRVAVTNSGGEHGGRGTCARAGDVQGFSVLRECHDAHALCPMSLVLHPPVYVPAASSPRMCLLPPHLACVAAAISPRCHAGGQLDQVQAPRPVHHKCERRGTRGGGEEGETWGRGEGRLMGIPILPPCPLLLPLVVMTHTCNARPTHYGTIP